MKICNVCNETKPLEEFDLRKNQAAGYCKSCRRAKMKAHYNENKQYYVDKAKKRSDRIKDIIRQAKSIPCADCEQSYPYYVMDFDHMGDKEFHLANGWSKSAAALKAELDKCEVACSNCHRERTWKRAS